MNSLKTDDILGARPRIRHAPKNLIREKAFNNQYYINEPQYINQVHMSQSFNERSPAGNPYRKLAPAPFDGYLTSAYQSNNPKLKEMKRYQLPQYTKSNQLYNDNDGKYFVSKQAPRLNYDEHVMPSSKTVPMGGQQRYYDGLQKQYSQKLNNNHNNAQYRHIDYQKQNSRDSRRSSQQGTNKNSKQARQGSLDSLQYAIIKDKTKTQDEPIKPSNMFRGLGYNIVTNHKFEYDMENTRINQTSKWLDKQ